MHPEPIGTSSGTCSVCLSQVAEMGRGGLRPSAPSVAAAAASRSAAASSVEDRTLAMLKGMSERTTKGGPSSARASAAGTRTAEMPSSPNSSPGIITLKHNS